MSLRKIENPEQFRINIRNKLNKFFDNEKHSSNLEKGIFNYTLKEASMRKVVKKWDNNYFVQIYLDRLRSIYLNLNPTMVLNLTTTNVIYPKLKRLINAAFIKNQAINAGDRKTKLDADIASVM